MDARPDALKNCIRAALACADLRDASNLLQQTSFRLREPQDRMFVLKDSTHIAAPLQRVFQLSCSLAIVERELGMHPVAGRDSTRTEGLVVGGDRIRWEGWQLGFWNYHVSLISAYEPNEFFQDSMIAGRFRFFQHDHHFTEIAGQVLLKDSVRFSLPYGSVGRLIGKHILVPHIAGLMRRRFALLKHIAESQDWREYLPDLAAGQPLEAEQKRA